MSATVTYDPDITEGYTYTSTWGGEEVTVHPIPASIPGIRLIAAQIGVDGPEDIDGLTDMIEEAARDTGRLPQVRIFLRHGAAELRTAAGLASGEERRWDALGKARVHMVRAWRTSPGSWGFSVGPGGVRCSLCGHDEPSDGYRSVPEAKTWYEQHAQTCTPLTPVACRECVNCGNCRTAPSAIHRCRLCSCYADDF